MQRSGSSPAASQSSRTSSEFSLILRGIGVIGGECVPVGHEEKAVVLVLHAHPVIQSADKVPQMQFAGGAHTAEHAFALA